MIASCHFHVLIRASPGNRTCTASADVDARCFNSFQLEDLHQLSRVNCQPLCLASASLTATFDGLRVKVIIFCHSESGCLSSFFDAPPFSLNYIVPCSLRMHPGHGWSESSFRGPLSPHGLTNFHQNQQVCLFVTGTNPNETRLVMRSPRMNNTPVC
jgi:hypothetical protein